MVATEWKELMEWEDMEEPDTEWEVVMAEGQKVVLEAFEVVLDQNLEMVLQLALMSFQAITKIPFAIHNLMKQAAK